MLLLAMCKRIARPAFNSDNHIYFGRAEAEETAMYANDAQYDEAQEPVAMHLESLSTSRIRCAACARSLL